MNLKTLLGVAILWGAVSHAHGQGRGIGVGVSAMLAGRYQAQMATQEPTAVVPIGPALVYDAAFYHIEAIFDYHSGANNTDGIGGGVRAWYHLHGGLGGDFSVGVGLGILQITDANDNSTTFYDIEAGGQLRVFAVRNVSFSAAAGLAVAAGDADGVDVTGDLLGSVGMTYFF